jgi:hypothetical protein
MIHHLLSNQNISWVLHIISNFPEVPLTKDIYFSNVYYCIELQYPTVNGASIVASSQTHIASFGTVHYQEAELGRPPTNRHMGVTKRDQKKDLSSFRDLRMDRYKRRTQNQKVSIQIC